MKKYGFKGLFFIMTVSLGKPHYMSREQVRILSDEGNTIGSHTWDHHNVKKYEGNDWITQLDKPTKTLEQITGKNIRYFAYPFGLWNTAAFPELKKRGFVAAFQLNEKPDHDRSAILYQAHHRSGNLERSCPESMDPARLLSELPIFLSCLS